MRAYATSRNQTLVMNHAVRQLQAADQRKTFINLGPTDVDVVSDSTGEVLYSRPLVPWAFETAVRWARRQQLMIERVIIVEEGSDNGPEGRTEEGDRALG